MISGTSIVAPVTTNDVKTLTGCPSNKVNYLITAAKTGGVNGRAFNTTEGGGNAYLGELIGGARPYWNIFSNESPGEWTTGIGDINPLIFRIKRDSGGVKYAPMLGAFRNYKHNSVGPEDNNSTIDIATGSSTSQLVGMHYRTGEYDWRKVGGGANAAQFIVINSGGIQVGASDVVSLTAVNMTLVADIRLTLASTVSPHKEVFTMRLLIGRKVAVNDFNIYGYVPADSTITFNIYQNIPAASLTVFVGSLSSVFRIPTTFSEGANNYSFTGTKVNATINLLGYSLNRIVYNIVNSTGTVGATTTVNYGFDILNEYPQDFEGFSGNTQEFVISKKRITPTSAYPYLEAIMYYTKLG